MKQKKKENRTPGQRTAALKTFAADTVYDVLGSILFAVGIYTFAKSGGFAPGGVSGLALIFNHLWNIPIGVMALIINIPVILISYRLLGHRFLLKSFKTMLISTFFLDVVFPHFPVYVGSELLSAVFSGVFIGGGQALIYMRGSSTGGSDFLNVSIRHLLPQLSMGQIVMMTDFVIICIGGAVFGNIDAVLYGVICTYVTSLVIDKILYGAGSGKLAIIITEDGLSAAKVIDAETGRGATLIPAIGAYSGMKKDVVLCVCGKSEIVKVRTAVHRADPEAFVMITEANEIFGEGFKPVDSQ